MRPIVAAHRYAPAASALFILVAFLLLGSSSSAQLRAGFDGDLPVTRDADLSKEIALGTRKQLAKLLTTLGVDPALIPKAVSPNPEPNLHMEVVEGIDARLLFLPCSGPGSPQAHFYLLRLNREQRWHAVDEIQLDCWWKPTSYEWIQVHGKAQPSLLVHHVNFGHGSGEVQDHMRLYEIKGSRLIRVLETEEESSETEMGSGKLTQHAASLLPFPGGALEETKIISEGDESDDNPNSRPDGYLPMRIVRVERRYWQWNDRAKSYVPGQFTTVAR